MGPQRRVERGCGDPLVFGQQVVRVLVEVRDTPNPRSAGPHVISVA